MKNQKLILGMLFILVISIIILFACSNQPKEEEAAGTIAKVDKYKKEQLNQGNVMLRTEFLKDQNQVKQAIIDLMRFYAFSHDIAAYIDQWWIPQLEKYYSAQGQKAIDNLRDFSDFIKNNNVKLLNFSELLVDLYQGQKKETSQDLEQKLTEFAFYVNQMLVKDSVFLATIIEVEKYITDAGSKGKETDKNIQKLKELRDFMLFYELQYALKTGDSKDLEYVINQKFYTMAVVSTIGNFDENQAIGTTVNDIIGVVSVNNIFIGSNEYTNVAVCNSSEVKNIYDNKPSAANIQELNIVEILDNIPDNVSVFVFYSSDEKNATIVASTAVENQQTVNSTPNIGIITVGNSNNELFSTILSSSIQLNTPQVFGFEFASNIPIIANVYTTQNQVIVSNVEYSNQDVYSAGYVSNVAYQNVPGGGYTNIVPYQNVPGGGYTNISFSQNTRGPGYTNITPYQNVPGGGYTNITPYQNVPGPGYTNITPYQNVPGGGYTNITPYQNVPGPGYTNITPYQNVPGGGYTNITPYQNVPGGGYTNITPYNVSNVPIGVILNQDFVQSVVSYNVTANQYVVSNQALEVFVSSYTQVNSVAFLSVVFDNIVTF